MKDGCTAHGASAEHSSRSGGQGPQDANRLVQRRRWNLGGRGGDENLGNDVGKVTADSTWVGELQLLAAAGFQTLAPIGELQVGPRIHQSQRSGHSHRGCGRDHGGGRHYVVEQDGRNFALALRCEFLPPCRWVGATGSDVRPSRELLGQHVESSVTGKEDGEPAVGQASIADETKGGEGIHSEGGVAAADPLQLHQWVAWSRRLNIKGRNA